MKKEEIRKNLKYIPNLLDYEKTCQEFNWKSAEESVFHFPDGKINSAYAYDLANDNKRLNKTALIWYPESGSKREFTFNDLHVLSNQFAQYLVRLGVTKGDRVFFFLPRIPEVYFGFLGAVKAGAIAGNFFAAFGTEALFDRLINSSAKIVVTNKDLVSRVSEIRNRLPDLKEIILVEDLEEKLKSFSGDFESLHMESDDPCYMLYTSSTGNTPVCGIVTPHKAIIQQLQTAKWVLDLKPDDIYWCTADPGWVTGTVYGILTPWNLGITQIAHEGRFDPEKWFSAIEENKVTVWYTAPTALRMLKAAENQMVNYDFSSLRHICSVGEALPADTIEWSLGKFGLPVHDTWWQTETGAIMIANLPGEKILPGSMGKPLPGLTAAILDENLKVVGAGVEGDLAFKKNWPSMMIDVFGNRPQYERYLKEDWFITGDRAVKDEAGYFWFIGRADDVIKTSGERVGPFEVESALMEHHAVAEAGVIGKPDPVRGQIIKAFVVLKTGVSPSDLLIAELQQHVKTHLAGHAYPREIEFVDKLPKNRSGKIVRRILKAKELGLPLGDTSTLES